MPESVSSDHSSSSTLYFGSVEVGFDGKTNERERDRGELMATPESMHNGDPGIVFLSFSSMVLLLAGGRLDTSIQ